MERVKYLVNRFGMIIPFVLTIICLLISNSVEEPHATRAATAMWVFFVLSAGWLVSWIVRVAISWVKAKKEIENSHKK